ncbi:Spo0E family sporulation regulatory protein-aspartic acid phosphatase [Ammoniphilus sp. 3BR4]|uniref:Spo0E family sporulation regulatory protein-aspartic acid phosphatase n=1 Tax=Ammoniphilus sp. 3BR4 TaxID=3158265 RepID=UPI0034653812
MVSIDEIRKEIEQLRAEMENKAMEHQLNFLHPEVVHLSQLLDKLIVQVMQEELAIHTCA